MLASNGLGNSSLAYLNYPTKVPFFHSIVVIYSDQVIIRSCKLIPVMLAGVVILRQT